MEGPTVAAEPGLLATAKRHGHIQRIDGVHRHRTGLERTVVTSDREIGRAKQAGVSFTPDPAGGADVVLSLDGREAGRGHVPRARLMSPVARSQSLAPRG